MIKNNIYSFLSAPAPRYVLRLFIVDRMLKEYLSQKINSFIEVGAGRGDVSAYVVSEFANSGKIFEVSADAIDYLKKRKDMQKSINLINGRIEHYTGGEKVDLLMAFEVIEHVDDEKRFLDALHRCLIPGGLLLLSAPAYSKNWTKQDEWAGHLRRYEKEELIDTIAASGFKIISFKEYGFPLTSLIRPAKQFYYRDTSQFAMEHRTMRSGLDRGFFSRIPFGFLLPIYWPFIQLQRLKFTEGLGDGFVLAAECRG